MRIVTKRYSDDVKSEIRQLKTEVTEAKTVLKNIVELCVRYFEDPNFQLVKQISSRFDRLRGESLDIKDLYEELLMIDSEFQARLISANKLNKNLLFYYTLSVVYLSLPLIFAFSQEKMGELLLNNYEQVIRLSLLIALSTKNRTGAENNEDLDTKVVSLQRANKEVDILLGSIKQKTYLQELFSRLIDLFDDSRELSIKNFRVYKKIFLGIIQEQMEKGLKSNLTLQRVLKDNEVAETIKTSNKKSLIKETIDYILKMRSELSESESEPQRTLSFRLISR